MGKREELRKKRLKAKRRKRLIMSLSILGVLAILLIILLPPLIKQSNTDPLEAILMPEPINRPLVDGDSFGNPDAPVKIENISNFLCSHCSRFALEDLATSRNNGSVSEALILDKYISSGKVQFKYLVYSWTPDDEFTAEEASYCAMDQDKFWEYRDMVFLNINNQALGDITRETLVDFAKKLDLDMKVFNECFENQKFHQKIIDNVAYAKDLGLQGTPSFLVNDRLVFASQLVNTIEKALAGESEVASGEQASTLEPAQEVLQPEIDLEDVQVPPLIERPQVIENSMGDPNAPVKVIYFANYKCGNCANFVLGRGEEGPIEWTLINDYISSGKVRYSFYPRSWVPEEPYRAEEATYCAREQGKFWEYRDLVYTNRNVLTLTGSNQKVLQAFAEKIGLDMEQFNACFDSHRYLEQVSDDIEYANSLGPINTLFFWVNGKAVMVDKLIETINTEL